MTARFAKVGRGSIALGSVCLLAVATGCSADETPAPAITLGLSAESAPTTAPLTAADPPAEVTEPDPGEDPEKAELLEGKPAGAPVTPEILMANIDEQAGQLTVIVYVPQIFEDGGECTAIVSNATVNLTQDSRAEADATGTACGQFSFALADLGTGAATITASYESAAHQGESAQLKVDIP